MTAARFRCTSKNPVLDQQSFAKPCGALTSKWDNPFSYSQTLPREERGKNKGKGRLALRALLLSLPAVAASGGGLADGEGAAESSLRHDGGGGDIHPLAACLASFFFGHRLDWDIWPHCERTLTEHPPTGVRSQWRTGYPSLEGRLHGRVLCQHRFVLGRLSHLFLLDRMQSNLLWAVAAATAASRG